MFFWIIKVFNNLKPVYIHMKLVSSKYSQKEWFGQMHENKKDLSEMCGRRVREAFYMVTCYLYI